MTESRLQTAAIRLVGLILFIAFAGLVIYELSLNEWQWVFLGLTKQPAFIIDSVISAFGFVIFVDYRGA